MNLRVQDTILSLAVQTALPSSDGDYYFNTPLSDKTTEKVVC